LLSVKDEDKPVPHHETAVARALQGQVVLNEARVFVNPKDNSGIEAVVSASPMRDADGRLIGALLLVRDVTELRHLQQRMNDAERHVAIGQMASGIAHDFNNVLNSIIQATAVLRLRNGPNDDRETYISMIENAARRGAEIISRVREYVRGGTGKVDSLNVDQIVREVLDLTEPIWRGEDKLHVETRLAPVSNVRANGADLRRVLTNLVVNAIQAMPNGGRLTIMSGQNGRRVFIAVEDTGNGISRQDQPKIFAPFYTTKPTGTGLGLSMAQRILLAEGGNITFVSEPGRGTKFTVDLPVAANNKETPARAA
jgi:signal transduction histidine kinase